MTATLARRPLRLAAAFSARAAKTWGLWTLIAFAAAAAGSALLRAATGGGGELATFVLMSVPLMAAGLGWSHTQQLYPRMVAVGVTRREFLGASALHGAAAVLATAAFTQLGLLYIDLTAAPDEAVFYGGTVAESFARPALYLACGAAAGAVMARFTSRTAGAVAAAFVFAAVIFREVAVWGALGLAGEVPQKDGVMLSLPIEGFSLVPVDAAGAVLFAALAWALLRRAPMRPRTG
ncbi:hypothetical protein GCM10009853_014460 [Glycomyces scopariae]|uniref:Tat (Twin-arginine translocation) pathway signal sequence n=1 Tax=Glycomyces sambucus TaxID=380244 RepID=A0A1G9IFP6_9ACTN|nr:twin-arginine translocation signal domain-containing protein [Glycomyces sambucus]SDL23942.1 Tat (twin-arginine translocation) pathway signal sequence [Glycomyces sambucus]